MSYPAQFLNRGHIYDLLIKNFLGPLGPIRPLGPLRGRVSHVVRSRLNCLTVSIVLIFLRPLGPLRPLRGWVSHVVRSRLNRLTVSIVLLFRTVRTVRTVMTIKTITRLGISFVHINPYKKRRATGSPYYCVSRY